MDYRNQATSPHERSTRRVSAVRAVLNGEKKIDVAQRFNVTRQTLYNWVSRHRIGGAEALAEKRRGRSRRRLLEPWQEAQIAGAIRILPPQTVNPVFTRWTRKAIAEYVELSFGVPFNTWQVDSHLRRWGFGSHREVRQAFQNNPG